MRVTLTLKSHTTGYTAEEWRDYENTAPTVDIAAGAVVEYLGHLPGGMVQVMLFGEPVVIHPAATVELSETEK